MKDYGGANKLLSRFALELGLETMGYEDVDDVEQRVCYDVGRMTSPGYATPWVHHIAPYL